MALPTEPASLYEAYEFAWQERERSGETGDEPLVAGFRVIASTLQASQGDRRVQELLLKAWREDVPPNRLTRFAAKEGAGSALNGVREIVDILKGSHPAWMVLPNGLSKVSKGWLGSEAENVKRFEFMFRPKSDLGDLLVRCEPVEVNAKGFRKIPIWLDLVGGDVADVLVGTEVIGRTTIAAELRGRLKSKSLGKRKVPDGTIQLRAVNTGGLEFRKLRAYFPK